MKHGFEYFKLFLNALLFVLVVATIGYPHANTDLDLVTFSPDFVNGPDSSLWYINGDVSFKDGVMSINEGLVDSFNPGCHRFDLNFTQRAPNQLVFDITEISADVKFPSQSEQGYNLLRSSLRLCINREMKNGDRIETCIMFYYDNGSPSINAFVDRYESATHTHTKLGSQK